MKLIHGWQDDKYVLLVMDNGKIISRISLKRDEAWEVRNAIAANSRTNTENTYENHEQIV